MSYSQTHLEPTLDLFDYDPFEDESPSVEDAPKVLLSPERESVIQLPQQPEYTPRVLEDRWYQTNALADIESRLPLNGTRQNGKGEVLVCPTGGGKTSIASRAIGKWLHAKKKVLILVDLERLLDQMRDDLAEEGIYPLIEKAEHSALAGFGRIGNCVLASMQTLHENRLAKWDRNAFDYIVVDECHCFGYEKIIAYFEKAQLLGLTATPLRADGRSLKEFFNYPYIITLTMREAIEGWNANTQSYDKPFLSRIEILPIDASHIDLTGIKIVGRDFDARELDKRIWEHTNWLASAILKATEGRWAWIYCPKITTAEAISKAMRDMGAKCAPYHSQLPDPSRHLKMFGRKELQQLTNVNMLIKGVNVPFVDCIVRVRASLNIAQATQEIGRGTRLSPGKSNCLVVEFNFKTGGKKLVGVLDSILDGADEDDIPITKEERQERTQIRERAEKLMQEGEERDVLKAIDTAKKQLSFEQEEARRKREEERQAKYKKTEVSIDFSQKYDPFGGLNKQGAAASSAREITPVQPEQMAKLIELSGGTIRDSHAKQFTEESAANRIQDLEYRTKWKMASEKQLRMMIDTLGLPPKQCQRMKKWEASGAINERLAEMAMALESHGFEYEDSKALPPWELAARYRKHCPIVPQEVVS